MNAYKSPKKDLLIFYGMPHSGKSSLAKKLVTDHGFYHVNMGELLRKSSKDEEFPFKQEVIECQKKGEIVSDRVALHVLDKALSLAVGKSVILDGFPRLPSSIPAFKELLYSYGRNTNNALIINFCISIVDSIHFANMRGRDDDIVSDTMQKRISNYNKIDTQTIEILSNDIHVEELEFKNGADYNLKFVIGLLLP